MSSTPTSPLSIAIIGAGRIGSAYAYQLARAGHDVTVVARAGSRRLSQLQRDHGIVLTTGERANVTVAEHLDEQAPFDLVIVTTLAHQVGPLLPALQRSQARCVHLMFVTPEAGRLRAAIGARRATFGMAAVLATLDSDGKLGLTIPGPSPGKVTSAGSTCSRPRACRRRWRRTWGAGCAPRRP